MRLVKKDFFRKLSFVISAAACALLANGCAVEPLRSNHQGLFGRLRGGDYESTPPVRSIARQGKKHLPSQNIDLAAAKSVGLRWPLKQIRVTSPFGQRGHEFHEGVDLRASVGTPVYSSQAGRVIYAGSRIRGYGRLIVIRHDHGIATVYAHNSRLLVVRGQRVRAGQKIAYSGRSGHVDGPHLHFEVRQGVSAVDPQAFMRHSRIAHGGSTHASLERPDAEGTEVAASEQIE